MIYEMNEEWVVYKEDIIPVDCYTVISVSQDCKGTKIILEGKRYSIQVKFMDIDSLRITDEGRRIRTYHEIESIQEYRKGFLGRPVFTVENSEFLDWLKKESAGIYTEFTHYAIMTIDDIIDIAAIFPPRIDVETARS